MMTKIETSLSFLFFVVFLSIGNTLNKVVIFAKIIVCKGVFIWLIKRMMVVPYRF